MKQIKVELYRKITLFKLQMLPFIRTLDFSFFARLVLFGGVLYVFGNRFKTLNEERVVCKQEGPDSPTRFSKTFGQEKKLDQILTSEDFKS